mgnify:FL=1
MRIQSIQTNTNFQGLGHKLVRMQKMQEGQSVVQRFSENIMQESKSEITKEIKKPTKEWFDNWFDGYINAQNATAMAAKISVGSKDILGVLETKEVQASEGKMLDSKFVTKTISYLLNEAEPNEKTVIVNKLAKLPKINYNQVDKNDISILEHILNAEDFQLLNLVSKTQLDYYPALDYTYEQIENPRFKQEVDKLNLNFKDLKDAVKRENLLDVEARLDDVNSPFYKPKVQGKELMDLALKAKSAFFFDDFTQAFEYLM